MFLLVNISLGVSKRKGQKLTHCSSKASHFRSWLKITQDVEMTLPCLELGLIKLSASVQGMGGQGDNDVLSDF
jgi:hypothetical protein